MLFQRVNQDHYLEKVSTNPFHHQKQGHVQQKTILDLWSGKIKESINTQIDSKTKLQELSLKRFKKLPIYKLISNTGPRHKPLIKVGVKLIDSKFYVAEGKSKKDAEQNAATKCLKDIK